MKLYSGILYIIDDLEEIHCDLEEKNIVEDTIVSLQITYCMVKAIEKWKETGDYKMLKAAHNQMKSEISQMLYKE